MNSFRVTFEDGNTLVTDMNASLEEAKAYYVGQYFQFGDTDECPSDKMVKAVLVEEFDFLDDYLANNRVKNLLDSLYGDVANQLENEK